jgi:hypothetical protein
MKFMTKSRKEDRMNETSTVVRFGQELCPVVLALIERRPTGRAV